MNSTGVIVRIRESGTEYGMHDDCADSLIQALVDAGHSVMERNFPAVIIGPLFAPETEWTCAHSGCTH